MAAHATAADVAEGSLQRPSKTGVMIDIAAGMCTPSRILVVGCGSGAEAGLFARAFGAETIGIDIGESFAFDHASAAPARLMQMDARELKFPDGHFDFVYSFHALEHIPGPERALAEMARVLRRGGHYLVGTPNRHRLLGYLGSTCSLRRKVLYNWWDWKKRLQGRWRNELGAHAGFGERELLGLTQKAFGGGEVVTDDYYRRLYSSALVPALQHSGFKQIAYPCVYVGGRRH